jgi:hypothetical protein
MIDEEVKKLLEDMERKCDMSAVLNGAEDFVAQALRDVGELHERVRQGVREAICALATHYDDLKDYPEYHKVATTLAGLDMILTPGFGLIIRAETERLGHGIAPHEMLCLCVFSLTSATTIKRWSTPLIHRHGQCVAAVAARTTPFHKAKIWSRALGATE